MRICGPAKLLRLTPPRPASDPERGWVAAKWGISENNRRAKYYSLTRAGRKQLEEEAESWRRMSAMINRVLGTS